MFGIVTKYDYNRGFGFIKATNGEHYFIHYSKLDSEYIARGYYVFFKSFINDRSDRNAKDVIVIEAKEQKNSRNHKKQVTDNIKAK